MSAMLCASPEDCTVAGLAAGPWGLWCNQLTQLDHQDEAGKKSLDAQRNRLESVMCHHTTETVYGSNHHADDGTNAHYITDTGIIKVVFPRIQKNSIS